MKRGKARYFSFYWSWSIKRRKWQGSGTNCLCE
jgi:hypothetical protein